MPKKIIKKKPGAHLSDALKKAHAARKARVEAGFTSQRNPHEKFLDKPTRATAINAYCFDCCGRENFRNRIKYCQIYDCPLWQFRPYSKNITKEQCEAYVEPDVKVDEKEEDKE